MLNSFRCLLRDHRDRLALAAVLVLSSAAGLALLAFRVYYSGTAGYIFMPWNLFLAWVPLAFALPLFVLARRGRSHAATLWTLGLLWLLFFPNAPYLLSEFVHLQWGASQRPLHLLDGLSPHRFVPAWFDAILLLTFAWNGLIVGFLSLHLVQQTIRARAGAALGWAAAVLVLGLSGFGVSLGRFQRWNSWDLFFNPLPLLSDVAGRLFNPLAHPQTTAVTVLFWLFLLMAYLSVHALRAPRTVTAQP